MAREKKIDREFGVDLEFMIIPSGNATLKSVISGEIDAGSIGPSAMIAAVVEGAELTTIGSNMVKVPHLLWVRGNINSIQDLIGKHWAISAPGDFSHSLGQALLYKYNIDPDKIDWLTLSGGADAARAQALLAGKIDAGALGPEFIPVLKQDPQIKALLEYGKELPQFVRQVVIVNNKSLKEKPEFIQAWVTALIKGSRYGLDHRDETIQLAAKILGVEPNTLGDAFNDHANGIIQPNFDITAEQMNYMQDLNLKLKVQKETVPVEKWLDLRFQKEAVRLLGEYKPARS